MLIFCYFSLLFFVYFLLLTLLRPLLSAISGFRVLHFSSFAQHFFCLFCFVLFFSFVLNSALLISHLFSLINLFKYKFVDLVVRFLL